ncbi:MAG: dihydrolipoamide acetyltransferase family protein [Thermoanaerobacteraceae bacterium]|nr:dihydrolipoamide acetyltransferase family protein [Thermoanaerobacteraceae bacterium]
MANVELMPKLGMTMAEGVILRWIKKEGDRVEQGEPLLEIQTDKVNIEEESSYSGVLLKILAPEGATVPINEPIAIIGEEGEDVEKILSGIGKSSQSGQLESENRETEKAEVKGAELKGIKESVREERHVQMDKPRATPLARKIAKENKLDLKEVVGSGPKGRIQRADVEKYLKEIEVKPAITAKPEEISGRVPLTGMRGIIADKMQKSMNTAPHFYVTMEIDMSEVLTLRERLNGKLKDVKISLNTILIKASATAIKGFPIVNAYVEENSIVMKEGINIGLAVALEDGLIVPVVKDADKKGLSEIAREERALVEKARNGKLMPDEYSGGSFTISNLGMFDVTRFTAIINQPEVAILAVGMVREVPVVVNGEIVIRPIMEATLSSDHRVIDGAVAARFLKRIKEILEDPIQMIV